MKELVCNTIVIVGCWNKFILTLEWVKSNLLNNLSHDVKEIKVEYPMNINGSLKFSTSDFSFFIVDNRLHFNVLNTSNESAYIQVIEIARSLLRQLPHTPLNALGLNFLFETEKDIAIFDDLVDNESLTKHIGKEISSQTIIRSYKINDSTLNLKITKNENSKYIFDFNFDYRVKEPMEIINIFGDENNILNERRKFVKNILNTIYEENV